MELCPSFCKRWMGKFHQWSRILLQISSLEKGKWVNKYTWAHEDFKVMNQIHTKRCRRICQIIISIGQPQWRSRLHILCRIHHTATLFIIRDLYFMARTSMIELQKKWWWVKMHVHILNHPPRNCLNTLEFIKTHHVRQGNENTFTPHLHTPCLHHIINPFRQVLIILNLITHKITCL